MLYSLLSFVTIVACMPLCIRMAYKHGLYDAPDGSRKNHTGNVPYTGGFGIIFAFIVGAVGMAAFAPSVFASEQTGGVSAMMVYIIEAAAIIILLGIFDDIFDLKYSTKFLYQFFAASLVILGAVKVSLFPSVFSIFESTAIVNSLGAVVSMLWIVGTTNAVNMIDGMDGLAGGSSLLSALTLGIIAMVWGSPIIAGVMFILAGTLLGFMIYNLNPAKVFMGDTGSMFIGFILSIFGWMLVDSGPLSPTAVIVPIVVLGLPISDTLLAFFRRIVRGKNPFSADLFHIHHMLKVRFNLNVRQTVLALYGVTLVYCATGITIALVPETPGWALVTAVLAAKLVFLHILGYTRLIFPIKKHEQLATLFKLKDVAVKNASNGAPVQVAVHANGNGHSNGNGHTNANGHTNGNGHATGNGHSNGKTIPVVEHPGASYSPSSVKLKE